MFSCGTVATDGAADGHPIAPHQPLLAVEQVTWKEKHIFKKCWNTFPIRESI